MTQHFQKKWFDDQLRFELHDDIEPATVTIGNVPFLPSEVLGAFAAAYDQEFNNWINEVWGPAQLDLRREILDFSDNANRYHDLREAVGREQVMPFVGSGMSAPSGLPTWAHFLLQVAEFTMGQTSEVEKLIEVSDFEGAMDLLHDNVNPRLFAERVEHNLRITDPNAIDGPVCLLPGLFPNLVITTNLDNVLETLYRMCGLPIGYTLSGSDIAHYRHLKDSRGRFLLKLHGDHKDQQGRVLLSSEYDVAYAPDSPLRDEITLLYRQYSLLFLGCSLGPDRTVNLIRQVANDDENIPKHYAFLEKPSSGEVRRRKENDLTAAGVFPIWYDLPHDEAIMALLDGLLLAGGTV